MSIEDEIESIANQAPYHITITSPAHGVLIDKDADGFLLMASNPGTRSITKTQRGMSDYRALGALRWAQVSMEQDMLDATETEDPLPDQDDSP